jgi:DNA-binding XRE family transcriptional regulator
MMAKNINEIIKSLPAGRQKKIEKRASVLIAEEMTLQELRRARTMTQVKLAKTLGVAQKQVSEIEKRTDMHISTLRRSIEALGGTLSLVAEFPDREPVVLTGISSIS